MRISGMKNGTPRTRKQQRQINKTRILSIVDEICNYAIQNGKTEQSMFDELEHRLDLCLK